MTKFGLAQSVRRVEDPRLLKGNGRYTDDVVLPGMLYGVVLRSPHASAAIRGIDTTAARAPPGVSAILHVDHVIPWSKGDKTREDNLRTLCATCNVGRSNRFAD